MSLWQSCDNMWQVKITGMFVTADCKTIGQLWWQLLFSGLFVWKAIIRNVKKLSMTAPAASCCLVQFPGHSINAQINGWRSVVLATGLSFCNQLYAVFQKCLLRLMERRQAVHGWTKVMGCSITTHSNPLPVRSVSGKIHCHVCYFGVLVLLSENACSKSWNASK